MNVIKELEIIGFKSFANKTTVSFEQDITAVVGPNGCGKSNILDSIKWVLGEKSVKSLRGEKLEDVIFSGTESKKPSSMAQVSIVFNNKDRIFAYEQPEIKITRRGYRDGQSHYLINDKKVTRKEVEELLMDTGIGKSSYSFMEQGKMDLILSSKPEDRRVLFEEAAGISRFKFQKESAEKDLQNTQFNITRLNDILTELKRERDLKKSQAEKTAIYNKLLERQKEHDLRIRFITLTEMQKKAEAIGKYLQDKLSIREKSRQKILQLQEKISAVEEKKTKNMDSLHAKDIQNKVNREKIEQWNNTIDKDKKAIIEIDQKKQNLTGQIQKLEKRIAQLKKDLDSQTQLTLELDGVLENAQKAQKQIDDEIKNLEYKIQQDTDFINKASEQQNQTRRILDDLRQKQEIVIQDLLNSLVLEKDKFVSDEAIREKQASELQNEIAEFVQKLSHILNNEGDLSAAKSLLQKINVTNWQKRIQLVSSISTGLRHLLFEKGGIHSQKVEIDEQITQSSKLIEDLDKRKKELQSGIEILRELRIVQIKKRESMHGEIERVKLQKANLKEKEMILKEQIRNEENSMSYFVKEFNNLEKELLSLINTQKNLTKAIENLNAGIAHEINQIQNLEKERLKLDEKKQEFLDDIKNENSKIIKINEEVAEHELKLGTFIGSQEAMLQDVYNDYNLTYDEMKEKLSRSRVVLENEKNNLIEVKKQIETLGPINPLAIDELNAIEELYNHNQTQLDDIIRAKQNILGVIEEIQKKSEELFLQSFQQIENNFKMVFQKLFVGGGVTLTLQEPEKPLVSGIEIQVQPPGKRPRSLKLLSGGEKAMTAISLMFAIYLVRSAPFCVLDEIDAPLDDQNVQRFLHILDDFKRNTQFILITHNKKTMAKADVIFGVTMQEPGESNILSVNLKK